MIDSHCHLFIDSLKNNFSEVIKRSIDNNITSILSINTNTNDFEEHYNLIKNYRSIFISCGQHPEYVNNKNIIPTKEIISISKNNNVIGIGETGIDLYHSTEHIKSQYKSFENHIEACLETNLPLIIHQRNSEKEIIDILSNYKNNTLPVVMHCFTGSKKLRDFCVESNYYISLSGIVTFKNATDLRDIIREVPLSLLLIETDSPFLTPSPYRGIKPNEPSYVYYVGKYLSDFFKVSINKFEKITDNNFYSLFKKAIRYKAILYED